MTDIRTETLKATGVQFLTGAGANGPYVRTELLKAWRKGNAVDPQSDVASEIGRFLKQIANCQDIANETLYEEIVTLHARAISQNADAVFKLNGETLDTLAGTMADHKIRAAFINGKFLVLEDFLGPEQEKALLAHGLERVETYSYHFEPRPLPGSNISHVFNSDPLTTYSDGTDLTAVFEKPIPLSNIKAAQELGLTYKPF